MRVIQWADEKLEEMLLILFTIAMTSVTLLQVFMRYIIGHSLIWTEEIARYCFIWLIYIGVSYAVKKQRHIKIDALLLLFKSKGKLIFLFLSNTIFLMFSLVVVYYGFDLVSTIVKWGDESPALQIPMWLIYIATPVGMGITAIRLIQQLIQQIRNPDEFDVQTEQERIIHEETDGGAQQ